MATIAFRNRLTMAVFLMCLPATVSAQNPKPQAGAAAESPEQFAARTAWWREARFGMFIHWGIYAVPADGEWHLSTKKMQVKDYEKFAPQFNPVKFDAARW